MCETGGRYRYSEAIVPAKCVELGGRYRYSEAIVPAKCVKLGVDIDTVRQ
jgi:hypothetical protein